MLSVIPVYYLALNKDITVTRVLDVDKNILARVKCEADVGRVCEGLDGVRVNYSGHNLGRLALLVDVGVKGLHLRNKLIPVSKQIYLVVAHLYRVLDKPIVINNWCYSILAGLADSVESGFNNSINVCLVSGSDAVNLHRFFFKYLESVHLALKGDSDSDALPHTVGLLAARELFLPERDTLVVFLELRYRVWYYFKDAVRVYVFLHFEADSSYSALSDRVNTFYFLIQGRPIHIVLILVSKIFAD
jgi:hypothetical protein